MCCNDCKRLNGESPVCRLRRVAEILRILPKGPPMLASCRPKAELSTKGSNRQAQKQTPCRMDKAFGVALINTKVGFDFGDSRQKSREANLRSVELVALITDRISKPK